jgi:hypothetical protein
MARKIVNGTVPSIGATFGTSTNITAMTNANPCVATFAAAHGIIVGDYVEITASGWPLAANRVFRASVVSTNDITLEGFNTTNTALYPAAGGVGSTGRRIITWVAIQQVNADGLTVDGGDQQFKEGQYIDSALQFRFPTLKTPINAAMVVDDDQSLSYWTTVRAAEAALTNYPVRMAYPSSTGFAVGTGLWTVSAAPAMTGNDVQKRTINVALASIFTEYTT